MKIKITETKISKVLAPKVKENGYFSLANELSLDITSLVKLVGLPIVKEDDIINIIFDLSKKNILQKEYENQIISFEYMSGLVEWSSPLHDYQTFATPFYYDQGIPVQTMYPDGSDEYFMSYVEFKPYFENVDSIIQWWHEFYLPKVYDAIMENIENMD